MVARSFYKIVAGLLAALLVAVGMLSLFLQLPESAGAEREIYGCVWEDGAITSESYASAYADFLSAEDSYITVERDGKKGVISFGESYQAAERTIRNGSLAELLSLRTDSLSRLERAAIYRAASNRIWYVGGWYVWQEDRLVSVSSAEGETLVLLSGSITSARLQRAGVKRLELRAEAEFTAKDLVGTEVETVVAYPPYSYENGAVYLDTGTARRLVAALPHVRQLTVSGADYADTGALLACTELESLTLPFVGNTPTLLENAVFKELAVLSSNGSEYFVPDPLKEVTVTGGLLVSHAFYRCRGITKVSLCGMRAENIHPDALIDCTQLSYVHTPRASLNLQGEFVSRAMPCGCTVYERSV